jgi:signal peptidase II
VTTSALAGIHSLDDRWLPDRLAVWIGYQVAAVFLVLDQATKHVAEQSLQRGMPVVPFLGDGIGWQLIYNEGGAWGFMAPSWFFLVVTVIVTAIVVHNLPVAPTLGAAVAYGMLLAGALGNATDRVFRLGGPDDPRFFHGHVVDFVAWGSFPRFNVADAAITVGFALLVLDLWLVHRAEQAQQNPDDGS